VQADGELTKLLISDEASWVALGIAKIPRTAEAIKPIRLSGLSPGNAGACGSRVPSCDLCHSHVTAILAGLFLDHRPD
jgi:hypothetical protein